MAATRWSFVIALVPALAAAPVLAAEASAAATLARKDCSAEMPKGARCWFGSDGRGGSHWIVVPADWSGTLVLHAHGGPALGAPKASRADEDLKRWSIWPRAGFAYAGSSYHQGGVEVRSAADDTERLRQLFVREIGPPKRTVLHGQSWGASVAAKGAETFTDGKPYDAVLLTSGVLGGGTRSYDFRLDLRVLWQVVCGNHPRTGEPAYPLWQGLPAGAKMARSDLDARIDECTGVKQPAAQRSETQQRNLKTLLDTLHIPERSLAGHLAWGTYHFQDIVAKRLGGRNPFGNVGARYTGSTDDEALNAKVLRYKADPSAVADFARDTDLSGRIPVPVLTVHAVDDPTAFVELESTFRETMDKAGTSEHLVQVFTSDHEHSYLSDVQYVAAIQALLEWVDKGTKPTPAAVAARCLSLQATWGAECRFLPDYKPRPLDSRSTPRER